MPPRTTPSNPHRHPSLSHPLLILDGGLGTTLTAPPYAQHFISATTPLWSSHLLTTPSGPDTLLAAHAAFARAGANVLLTATYQASFEGFRRTPTVPQGAGIVEEDAARFMRAAVKVAREGFRVVARKEEGDGEREEEHEGGGRKGVVALSLGAYGATLLPSAEYSGEYPEGMRGEEALGEWHWRRLQVFFDEGVWREVDVVAFETLPRLEEIRGVRAAMRAVEECGVSEKPFWISCVFPGEGGNEAQEGHRLPDGSTVREVVDAMLGGDEARPWAVGVNCTKIWKVRRLLEEVEWAIAEGGYETPRLVLYPDGAGNLVYDTSRQEWLPRDGAGEGHGGKGKGWGEEMADIVRETQERGKWKGMVVGGCCMTEPEEIRELSERLI
ncbi:uncharacterized protein HMPREF1541_01326 [Cyphellophora europaea CBS 101466]|uniref:Hcy-binding domain-containing protein n=1 Tax=Cyphellophora europaea (strain CBS 101466) TaxID=1220924 RepID=W2SEH4_CYPE1|nr:uncharacterized protein HMPREF1541_01326 [Cyphellophora europaea CBS 101466]ETN47136.1 hypothetical protein HMPREF1541_01326 [Cyphellophora europaea CBS 101466]